MSVIHYTKSSYGSLDEVLDDVPYKRKKGGTRGEEEEEEEEEFEDFPELQGRMAQSREQLTMDMQSKSDNSIFRKPTGCYMSRGKVFGLASLCLICAVIVAFVSHQITKDHWLNEPCSLNGGGGDDDDEKESPKITDVRLPRNIIPTYYKLELIPHTEEKENFTLEGQVWINLMCEEETSKVTVHMKHLVVDESSVALHEKSRKNNMWLVEKQEYDKDREFYNITFNRPLEVGHNYTLYIKYTGELNDDLAGFYRSSYKDKATGEKRYIGVTQFQPTDARRAFPCFDEPEFKAEFEVSIGRKTSMSSISNMDLKNTEPISGMEGWVMDHYNKSVPMSTYLVAFVVSDFEFRVSNASLSKPMYRVWARKDAIEQAEYARDIGPRILTHFEDYFKIDFPLPKQDMIALPDFNAGAMENWGLITYRETAMLYDEKESSDANRLRIATVIAHELAHQWYGNLVTPSWWSDLWLNEGFASYVEYIGVDFIEPDWKILEQFVVDEIQNVFSLDALDSSHPISVEVNHPDEVNEIFDRISYGKGASIIRMMNHFLSEASFKRGLTNYLNKYRYSSTIQDNLWESLSKVAHEDHTLDRGMNVKEIMDTWTLQKGFPVIYVERNYPTRLANFTQTKFQLIKNETRAKEYEDYRWWVPISFASKSINSDFSKTMPEFWMSKEDKTVERPVSANKTEWLIVNVQETGYYRVNYDLKNWQYIIDQLRTDHTAISTVNRAQLLDDALNLARASLLSYDVAFGVTMYLKDDDEYIPWDSFLNSFGYISTMLSKSPAYGTYKKYILDLVVNQYDKVGFTEKPGDSLLTKFHRINILNWACSFGHQECIENSKQLFSEWMNKTEPTTDNPISPNLRRLVYCNAIKHGGEKEWDFAWQRYLDSNVGTAKTTILSALSCSKETWILNRYLNWSMTIGSGIRKQDGAFVFRGVANNEVGNFLAFNFLRDKWVEIKKYFGSSFFSVGNIVKSISNRLNTPFELLEMEKFREKYEHDLGAAKRAVDQAIEGVQANVQWLDDNYIVIEDWLKDATTTINHN